MVKNQFEFNNSFSKSSLEIKIRYKKFVGELVIENYPELKNLQLLRVNKINKLTLANLPNLQDVIVQGCDLEELIIENCLQIKLLNIKSNSLSNLNFLVELEGLEQLDIENNDQLSEILKSYKGDWKAYQRDLQVIKQGNFSELVQKFDSLRKNREDLKRQVATLLRDKEKFVASKPIITKELVLNLSKEFQDKEERISYLTFRSEELTEASKKQKNNIISSFLRLLPEQELVQNLIIKHFDFIKFKKQAIEQVGYSKQKREYEKRLNELKDELWNKLNEEETNKLEMILTDCEELAQQELELENRLNDKSALIAIQEKDSFNEKEREIIAKNSEIQQKQLAELEDLKKAIREFMFSDQPLISKLLSELEKKAGLTNEESNVVAKIGNLIQKKSNFLAARQETIQELRLVCDRLELATNSGKYAQLEEGSKALAIAGKAAGVWTLNLIEVAGEVANLTTVHFKRLFTTEQSKQFQLTLEDELEINEMEKAYQELLTISNLEGNLFSSKYKIYEVVTSLWVNKAHIDVGDMKTAIALLTERLRLLSKEVKVQEKAFSELIDKLGIAKSNLICKSSESKSSENDLQIKIQQLKTQLATLVDEAKTRLVSNHWISSKRVKRDQEIADWLQSFQDSDNGVMDPKLIKRARDEKVSLQELTEAKTTLNNLQGQLNELEATKK